jgi:fluoride exporter
MLRSIFLACLGGALGSGLRLAVTTFVVSRVGTNFPYATMGINIAGCFLIGFIAELSRHRTGFSPDLRVFLIVGILGGFTTFSSFSYDVLNLFGKSEYTLTMLYMLGSVAIGIAAAYGGASLVRAMAGAG